MPTAKSTPESLVYLYINAKGINFPLTPNVGPWSVFLTAAILFAF